MRRLAILLVAVLQLAAPVACAYPTADPSVLDFETAHEPPQPPGWAWVREDSDYALELLAESARSGSRGAALRARVASPKTGFVSFQVHAHQFAGSAFRIRIPYRTRGFEGDLQGLTTWYRIDAEPPPDGERRPPLSIHLSRGEMHRSEAWASIVMTGVAPPGAHHFHIGLIPVGEGEVDVDDIEIDALDESTTAALTALSTDERDYLNRALDLLQSKSLFVEADWEQVRRAAFVQARAIDGVDGVYQGIVNAMMIIGDRHSGFLRPAANRQLQQGSTEWSPEQLSVSSDGIALLRLSGFVGIDPKGSERFARALRQSVVDVADSVRCGWVIDLREHRGGNMWPELAGVAPLLNEGSVGQFVDASGASRPWTISDEGVGIDGEVAIKANPARPHPAWSAPVLVVVGPATASSGEALAISFSGRDQTRFTGQRTAGLTTANEVIKLRDGAAMVVATSWMADRDGTVFRAGIDPDEPDLVARGDPVAIASPGSPSDTATFGRLLSEWADCD